MWHSQIYTHLCGCCVCLKQGVCVCVCTNFNSVCASFPAWHCLHSPVSSRLSCSSITAGQSTLPSSLSLSLTHTQTLTHTHICKRTQNQLVFTWIYSRQILKVCMSLCVWAGSCFTTATWAAVTAAQKTSSETASTPVTSTSTRRYECAFLCVCILVCLYLNLCLHTFV